MDKLYLHAVLVDKTVGLEKARELAQDVIKDKNKTFVRETAKAYNFRNIPKPKFVIGSFVHKRLNDKVILVFGRLEDV